MNNTHSSSSGEDSLNEDDDDVSIAGTETTETTETTLVDRNESDLQVKQLYFLYVPCFFLHIFFIYLVFLSGPN